MVAKLYCVLLAPLLLSAMASCTDSASPGSKVAMPEAARVAAAGLVAGSTASGAARTYVAEDLALIRTAALSLQVAHGAEAAEKVAAIAREFGGYVSEEQSQLRARAERRSLTLRVEAVRLDEALVRLEALAVRVLERRIGIEDVSAQLTDVAARLKTLRTTEQELQELLAGARESGRGLEDVVAVHRELTSIRTQIEQIAGQERGLKDRVALATITVELVLEPEAASIAPPTWQPLRFAERCLVFLVTALQTVAELAMIIVLVVLPIAVVIGTPFWLVRRRRLRTSSQAAKA